jgi:hypothetical protein
VSSSSYYYVHEAQFLSHVTFVPYSDKTGPVVISYNCYTEDGTLSGSGKLYIYIVDSPAGVIQYSVRANGSTALSADDFSTSSSASRGGYVLCHLYAAPRDKRSMYYQYDSDTGTGTKVTGAIKYYNGKGPIFRI